MALVLRGGSAVMWHASKTEFPYFQGTLLCHDARRHCCRCLRRTVSPLQDVLLAIACSRAVLVEALPAFSTYDGTHPVVLWSHRERVTSIG